MTSNDEVQTQHHAAGVDHTKDRAVVSKKRPHAREYVARNSILIDKFKNNPDMQIIYNMFFAILISLLINTAITDYLTHGQINFGQNLIRLGFNNVHLLLAMWLVFNALVFAVYGCFMFWARVRCLLSPKTALLWDKVWLALLTIHYLLVFYLAQKSIGFCELAPGSAMVLLSEHVRLVMKQHSFIRSNAPKVINYKPHSEQELVLPSLEQLAYFIIAPVMIYKDHYPRTKEINWSFVLKNVIEIFSIILFYSLLTERFLKVTYSDYCLRKFTWKDVILTVLGNLFPGIMFMLCGFYAIIHATQNAFAEILRFGDRQFYKEWWASRSLSEWLRTWNVLVQDWLFLYIYREFSKNRVMAMLLVFFISGIVHEWIISVSFNLFLPVQSLQFVTTGVLLGILGWNDKNIGNVAIWYFIALGASMQISLYSIEFFARKNCPIENQSTLDFFKPRFLTCNCTG